jgi:hypothetical protein
MKGGSIFKPRAFEKDRKMKATPSAKKAADSKHEPPKITAPSKTQGDESVGLSAEQLKDRAFSSSRVMTEILERDRNTYSFRHWGINE